MNSVSDVKHKEFVLVKASDVEFHNDMYVPPCEILHILKLLCIGKSPGPDGLTAENLKYANDNICILLSLLFSSLFSHSFVPVNLTKVTLVPLIKNKAGDITDRDNYRPIALATILSKVAEHLLLNRCEEFLHTSSYQFGFKSGHATDLCIYALKETIQYYKLRGSPVFACFLDARKAFDRVNHWSLLKKLLTRGAPCYIVKFLMIWFQTQLFCVQWGASLSEYFHVSNGVRQGGIISPRLFNMYVDELNYRLSKCGVGCNIGGSFLNNFSYADDMVLICPSVKGLRLLISICEQFAVENDIIYNTKKTECMIFCANVPFNIKPVVKLNGIMLNFVDRFVYLGHVLVPTLSDDEDISRQYRSLCSRANMLKRKFCFCSLNVKICLFNSYCATLYTSHLWTSFKSCTMRKFTVCYNNAFRIIVGLRKSCSASAMFVNNGVLSFGELYRKIVFRFVSRRSMCNNSLIRKLCSLDLLGTVFTRRWQSVLYTGRFSES